MNTRYTAKLFNGEIDNEIKEEFLALSSDYLKDPDLFPGKITELNLRVKNVQEAFLMRLAHLEKEVIEWNQKEAYLKRLILFLESKINDRLFLRSDTDNFFETHDENFLEPVTSALPSVRTQVDLDANIVTLLHAEDSANRLIAPNSYTLSTTKAPGAGTERVVVIEGSNLSYLWNKNNSTGWTATVTTTTPKAVGIVVNVSFDSPTDLGSAVLQVVNSSSSMTVSAIAIDSSNNGTIVIDNADITFTNILNVNKQVKTLQIVITKHAYDEIIDSGEYRYIFSLKNLYFNKKVTGYETSGIFYGSTKFIKNANRFALEVCDFETENISLIDYYLNISQGESLLRFPITPINKPPSSAPYAVKLLTSNITSNLLTSNLIDPVYSATSLVSIKPELEIFNPGLKLKVLNSKLLIKPQGLKNFKVFTNCSLAGASRKDALEKVGQYYYTWIYVDKDEKRVLEVGNSGISIQGFISSDPSIVSDMETTLAVPVNAVEFGEILSGQKSNKIILNKTGWFKVQIPISSYFSVGEEFSDETELKELDPYYPYNAKYLIEGTNLNLDPYKGFAKRAQRRIEVINDSYQLDNNTCSLLRTASNVSNSYCLLFLNNFNAKNCYVEYATATSGVMIVILEARMRTSDRSVTPIISSYKIKVGE